MNFECATDEQIAEWRRKNNYIHTDGTWPMNLFCRDCTFAYKAKMVSEGRCCKAKKHGKK